MNFRQRASGLWVPAEPRAVCHYDRDRGRDRDGQGGRAAAGGGGGGESLPSASVLASDGFAGAGNVWATHMNDVYGGNGYWNTAWFGNVFTKSGGVMSFSGNGGREPLGCLDDVGSYTSPSDAGVLLVDYTDSDDATVPFHADAICKNVDDSISLKLASGAKPRVALVSRRSTSAYTEYSDAEFDQADVLGDTTQCILLRTIEVAGTDGGYRAQLWTGSWDTDLATTLAGMTLVQTLEFLTADARTIRDAAAFNRRWIERPASASAGNSTTIGAIAWLDFTS